MPVNPEDKRNDSTSHGQRALLDALKKATEKVLGDWNLSYIEIVGCLESFKQDVWDTSAEENADD
jgi:hypothetical protein